MVITKQNNKCNICISDRVGTAEAWYPSSKELDEMRKMGLNIDFRNQSSFYQRSLKDDNPHPIRALRVHQMAQAAISIQNKGKILEAIAKKHPELVTIMQMSQLYIYECPMIKISRISLESTLFGPMTIMNVLSSNQLLSVVAKAKEAWNKANSSDLMVFKRLEMPGGKVYVGLRPESCPELTPFIKFRARNHKFVGRIKISVCAPTTDLTYPDAVENVQPPYNLKSRNPPLIATVLECIDIRFNNTEWDRSLMIKIAFTNDVMSLFSFNENQRHGEGSFLHQYSPNPTYNDDTTITPIQRHQYHLDFINDHQGNKLSIYEFMFGAQTFSV